MSRTILASLVGSSPLPILLGCRDLATQGSQHLLICSRATEPTAKKIAQRLGEDCLILVLNDPKDPAAILRDFDAWSGHFAAGRTALNYTGGTKPMSAAAVACLAQAAGGALWYLDETTNHYRNFEGRSLPASMVESVEEVLTLHDWEGRVRQPWLSPGWQDLCRLYDSACGLDEKGHKKLKSDGELLGKSVAGALSFLPDNQKLSALCKKWSTGGGGGEEWQAVCGFAKEALPLIQRLFPSCAAEIKSKDWPILAPGSPISSFWDPELAVLKEGAAFLQGMWLECFVRKGLEKAFEGHPEEIKEGWEIWPADSKMKDQPDRNRDKREVDGVILRQNGLTFVSVTRADRQAALRSKLYEAISLAGAAGGPLAKAVVAAPAGAKVKNAASLGKGEFARGWVCGFDLLDALREEDHSTARRLVLQPPPRKDRP